MAGLHVPFLVFTYSIEAHIDKGHRAYNISTHSNNSRNVQYKKETDNFESRLTIVKFIYLLGHFIRQRQEALKKICIIRKPLVRIAKFE